MDGTARRLDHGRAVDQSHYAAGVAAAILSSIVDVGRARTAGDDRD